MTAPLKKARRTDSNGDLVTQEGELHSLASLGIANIDLAGVAASTGTISGNPSDDTSKVTSTDRATATISEAHSVRDNINSCYAEDYTLGDLVIPLPLLRGHGALPDLSIAMSQDWGLRQMLLDLASDFSLTNLAAVKPFVERIILRWARVDETDPSSRGPNIDARHFEFVEKMFGTDFVQTVQDSSDPQPVAAAELERAYQSALTMFYAGLLVQIGFQDIFSTPPDYDVQSATLSGSLDLSHDAISRLAAVAPSGTSENEAFWVAFAGAIDAVKGIPNLAANEVVWINETIATSNTSLDWPAVTSNYHHDIGPVTTAGAFPIDIPCGGIGDDTIQRYQGNDIIHVSFGNDALHGDDADYAMHGESDALSRGDNNDKLYWGYGDGI
jgi:hypothetical protein